MDWGQKKIFVSGLIDVCPPKSRKKNSSCTVPKKTVTLNYHLKKDNKRLSVCKLMFLNTLGIGEWSAREWALKGQHKSSLHVKKCNVPLKPKGNEHLESFLNELPKIPSHYCRSQSSKLYLEPIFKSQKEVFDVYVENCSESKIKPLSLTQFKKFFIKMNIGLFQPKKDQCDLCCMHEVNNISEEKWLEHQQMKEDARREMKADTERAKLDKSLMAYSNLKYYSSIRPGKKAGDPVVTDLRALKYNGSDLTIEYKFKMTDAWQSIPQRPGKFSAEKPVGLYKSALGIQKDNLKINCIAIEPLFYKNLILFIFLL
nr:unnamed protein product [Callosobruchus analis]